MTKKLFSFLKFNESIRTIDNLEYVNNINYKFVEKELYKFFKTGDFNNLLYILNNKKYHNIKNHEIIWLFMSLYDDIKVINNKLFVKYNNQMIPVIIKTNNINDITKDMLLELEKYIEKNNYEYYCLLYISPKTLYETCDKKDGMYVKYITDKNIRRLIELIDE